MSKSVYLLLFSIITTVHTERNYRFFIQSFAFKNIDLDVFESLDTQVLQLDNRSFVSGQFIMRRLISQFDVRASIDLMKSKDQKKRIIDVRVDGCRFLKGGQKTYLFNIIVKTIQRHTSANVKCPLEENVNYSLENWHLDGKDLPGYFPKSAFQGFAELEMRQKKFASIKYFGQIIRV
ncbi:hypothetical protein KR222_004929 [Zaprionus bogoriensis]|nr:hypothetical protein KR222_004929 [Zaprionus bogoriensis]